MGAINDFQAAMKRARGFARVARYEVVLHPPAGLVLPGGPSYSNDVNIFCDSIMMPGHDLNTSAVKFGTEVETQMVTSHKYEGTIDATFYLDHNLDLKEYFDAWQEQAVSTDRNAVSYYKTNEGAHNYVGSMEIYQLSTKAKQRVQRNSPGPHAEITDEKHLKFEDERTYGIFASEVYPKTIGAVSFGASSANEISTLDVRFEFRQWYNMGTDNKFGKQDAKLRPF